MVPYFGWFHVKTISFWRTRTVEKDECCGKHHKNNKKWWRSMRIDSPGRRRGLTPFILLPAHFTTRPHPSSLRGVRLNVRGCAAKVLYAAQLPRRSSSRVGAERWDERGRRRTGQVRAPFHFNDTSLHIPWFSHSLTRPKVLQHHLVFTWNHRRYSSFY